MHSPRLLRTVSPVRHRALAAVLVAAAALSVAWPTSTQAGALPTWITPKTNAPTDMKLQFIGSDLINAKAGDPLPRISIADGSVPLKLVVDLPLETKKCIFPGLLLAKNPTVVCGSVEIVLSSYGVTKGVASSAMLLRRVDPGKQITE